MLAVVTGHIVGVIAAHDRAITLLPKRHHVTGQLGMLVVMVAYTATGLYLLMGGRSEPVGAGEHGVVDLGESPGAAASPRARRTDLAGHQGPVGGGPVLGQEVHAGGPDVALDHADDVAPAPAQ